MNRFYKIFSRFRWKVKRIHVYALVGKTGTGKSFRARLVTDKHNINLVVDDGLLIRDHRILAGKSAKREKSRVTAIKRAIFDKPDHASEVRKALEKEKFKSILIIGISDKMITRIVERLNLPAPDETIYIEDIATEEDITKAKYHRRNEGKHVIPVPMIEVRKDPAPHIIDSIKFFLKSHPLLFWKRRVIEKTIVQPPFTRRGRLSISEAALSQMIMHCVQEFSNELAIKKIIIDTIPNGYCIEIKLILPFGLSLPDNMSMLQEYIVTNIERFSGIHIESLDLTVDQIKKQSKHVSKSVKSN